MLFADVCGSTTIAESIRPAEFTKLIGGFYEVATNVLVRMDTFMDRLAGDEYIELFAPWFAEKEHAKRAIQAAKELDYRLDQGAAGKRELPIGVGIHTGIAFIGVVQGTDEGPKYFTALGEILISDRSYQAVK